MQSLIHGNFEGAAQKATYALVGAAAAIAAAVGPLIGGFITTFLSYRVAFVLEVVVIAIVLSAAGSSATCRTPARARSTSSARVLSVLGMGGLVLGILVWQEGGEAVGLLLAVGAISLGRVRLLARAPQARGQADADRPGSVHVQAVPARDLRAVAPERSRWAAR